MNKFVVTIAGAFGLLVVLSLAPLPVPVAVSTPAAAACGCEGRGCGGSHEAGFGERGYGRGSPANCYHDGRRGHGRGLVLNQKRRGHQNGNVNTERTSSGKSRHVKIRERKWSRSSVRQTHSVRWDVVEKTGTGASIPHTDSRCRTLPNRFRLCPNQ